MFETLGINILTLFIHTLFIYIILPLISIRNNFEKRPLYIKRRHTSYYSNLVSTPLLDKILREKNIFYTKNIDITSYVNGVRETHNIPGRAVASAVWEQYRNKCSVRMLNPQTFIPEIYILCGKNIIQSHSFFLINFY